MFKSNIAFHSNRSHSSRISTASHLHLSACPSLWLRPVKAILYTWLTSLRGTDDLHDATLECARGKFFPVWRKIRNYLFGIFNFDAGLEWCKFRALTVLLLQLRELVQRIAVPFKNCVLHIPWSGCMGSKLIAAICNRLKFKRKFDPLYSLGSVSLKHWKSACRSLVYCSDLWNILSCRTYQKHHLLFCKAVGAFQSSRQHYLDLLNK